MVEHEGVWRSPPWLAALTLVGSAGLLLVLWTLRLPWQGSSFDLAPAVRILMASAGTSLLALVCVAKPSIVASATALLGTLTLAYPSLLAIGVAYPENPVATLLSTTGHITPIVLMQLIPVLASSAAAGRTRHGREAVVIAVAVLGTGFSAAGTMSIPGAAVLSSIGGSIWFAQPLIAPVLTGLTARALAGEPRRRALMATLAATVPLVLIAACLLLGASAEQLGLGVDGSVAVLMLGFSAAVIACGALSLGSTAASGSRALRPSVIIAALDSLLIALVAVIALATTLLAASLDLTPTASIPIGAVVAVVSTVAWQRSRRWTARVVDPASAFRGELRAAGMIADGDQRQVALQALRRAADDRALQLRFRVGRDVWVDEKGGVAAQGSIVIARREDGEPAVGAIPGDDSSAARIAVQGDCSSLLDPALFEAQLAHESGRADLAAESERRRLQRNLHDGLQGRLLGLALGLQLSGRSLEDPTARLMIVETVDALRSLVEDVRTLSGGDLPAVLQAEGLEPALRALLAPVGAVVTVDISPARFAPSFEEIAYFVVGEAVTNALKHADARSITVRVSPTSSQSASVAAEMTVTVSDDGCGGADPRGGTGLRSLAERVTASGGTFLVRDDFERGTVVEAVLRCGS